MHLYCVLNVLNWGDSHAVLVCTAQLASPQTQRAWLFVWNSCTVPIFLGYNVLTGCVFAMCNDQFKTKVIVIHP